MYKSTVPPWVLNLPLLLQMFLWPILKHRFLALNSVAKPTIWKRYIDDIFPLWDVSKPDIDKFIEQANSHHPTIKFTAEISTTETTFLDTVVYKGKRFRDQSILDIKTCQKGIREGRSSKTVTN